MTDELTPILEENDLSVSDFTAGDRDFLKAVANTDGSADTTTLRETSGLERKQVHYRYDKLEEIGVIDVQRVGVGHDGSTSNTAELSEYGRRLVDAGLCGEIDDPNRNLESLKQQVDSLKGRVEHLERSRRRRRNHRDDRLDELAERIDRLEENVAVDEIGAFTHAQEREVHKIVRRRLGVSPELVGDSVRTILPAVSTRTGAGLSYPINERDVERFEELSESDADTLEERIEWLESVVDRPRDA